MKKNHLFLLLLLSSLAFGQNINIPDPIFKSYLVGNNLINTNSDTEIQLVEANSFTGSINCQGLNISNLTGIEAFTQLTELNISHNFLTSLNLTANTALTHLECSGNSLSMLNVSANTALTHLYCSATQLSSLDVSANTALSILDCPHNQLTSLDVTSNTALTLLGCSNNFLTSLVTANPALTYIRCSYNQLTSLDVSSNPALTFLDCSTNQLTSLDVTSNSALVDLNCFNNQLTLLNVQNGNNTNFTNFDAHVNPNLTCIQVDNVAYSNANWTSVDAGAIFSTSCTTKLNDVISGKETKIAIYPNPTRDQIIFSEESNVQLCNVIGQIIYYKKNVNSINLSEFPNGIYVITLSNLNGEIIQRSKIVKE